ncbi:MAG: hypothetical protein ACI9BW_000527 [Gammaproteobacteria bacterium]|jgi:hypothetical protein
MRKFYITILLTVVSLGCTAADDQLPRDIPEYRQWVSTMKTDRRGPFAKIRWFCNDGQVLLPKPFACVEFGGGHQHGLWSEQTLSLRKAGFKIANFYADLDINSFVKQDALSDPFAQMLVEQFLIRLDDGWILRRALYYRGAYQAEQERDGARKLLLKLAENPDWLNYRFLMLRSAAQFLPHGSDTASVQEIRQLSASLSDRDPNFKSVRNKIHGRPELTDAKTVRSYQQDNKVDELSIDFARLASLIEQVHTADIGKHLKSLNRTAGSAGNIKALVERALSKLSQKPNNRIKVTVLSQLLFDLREQLSEASRSRQRLAIIDASLAVENELFTSSAALESQIDALSRRERIGLLADQIRALYGVGLISKRQFDAATSSVDKFFNNPSVDVQTYKGMLDYLALAPNWGTQNIRRFFGDGIEKLSQIEPKSAHFIQDQLRSSPLFHYALVLDGLARDANELAGVRNELFGKNVGVGLRGLNPGLAHGRLQMALGDNVAELDVNGIYLLPETLSELPPVAGILTAGEGNPLSHVQLLARNLGIPNVGVDQNLIEELKQHAGQNVSLAVSPAGSVRLSITSSSPSELTQASNEHKPIIRVEVEKLKLTERSFLKLSELRSTDSGKVVGPKAAKLGELKHHYPQAVAEGLTIPFGIFRDLLEHPMEDRGVTVFGWMQSEYARLGTLERNSALRRDQTELFRAKLEAIILNADPGDEFRSRLRSKMIETFGEDGKFGVFVRSDTNVEDLPGFTGAGLNLTVANVVGIDNVIRAISKVWASPFSARSFAWRQTLMDMPEHVYPAVLLMRSVDADKSGVLVTQDIDSGDKNWLSVAVNEGVGGAVDGQSAESLRINIVTGDVKLMAAATASVRRKVDLAGGVKKLPVSSSEFVLLNEDIDQLITLAKELPTRFPAIVDASGHATPADIEFGFLNGELKLFQIRPFLENDQARNNSLLQELDSSLAARENLPVSLDALP